MDHDHGEEEASPAPLTDPADAGHSCPFSCPTTQAENGRGRAARHSHAHSVHGQAWGLTGTWGGGEKGESSPPSACQTTCLGAGLCPTAGAIYSAFRNALYGRAAVSFRAEPFKPPSSPGQVKNSPVQKSRCVQMGVCQK